MSAFLFLNVIPLNWRRSEIVPPPNIEVIDKLSYRLAKFWRSFD